MGWIRAIWKASCSPRGILILFALANGGCQTPRNDPAGPVSSPHAFAASPSGRRGISDQQRLETERAVSRGVSSEDSVLDAAPNLPRGDSKVPSEVPTYALNPVLDLLKGNSTPQTDQDAYQTLGLLGITGMVHMMRSINSNPGGKHTLRHVADFTDDLLQPDEEAYRGKRLPYIFGLEWKY